MQFINHTASDNEMLRLTKLMEEMANAPKEEFGKRSPGEKCAMERQYEKYSENLRVPC